MKYLVMEVKRSYVVLLDEEGRFLPAANLGYERGQTIENPVLMKYAEDDDSVIRIDDQSTTEVVPMKSKNKAGKQRWIAGLIIAAATVFLMIFGVNYYQNNALAHSSIYLTINPDVQMELNKNGNVINLIGENEDGKALLEGYEITDKDKQVVATELIDRAIDMGFLADGDVVNIAINAPSQRLFEEYGNELKTSIREHLDGRITITIDITTKENAEKRRSIEDNQGEGSQIKITPRREDADVDDEDNRTQAPVTQPPRTAPPQTQAPRTYAPAPRYYEDDEWDDDVDDDDDDWDDDADVDDDDDDDDD